MLDSKHPNLGQVSSITALQRPWALFHHQQMNTYQQALAIPLAALHDIRSAAESDQTYHTLKVICMCQALCRLATCRCFEKGSFHELSGVAISIRAHAPAPARSFNAPTLHSLPTSPHLRNLCNLAPPTTVANAHTAGPRCPAEKSLLPSRSGDLPSSWQMPVEVIAPIEAGLIPPTLCPAATVDPERVSYKVKSRSRSHSRSRSLSFCCS